MVQFPRYESYKDSGIEWLGEIPSHWNTKELKYIVDINLSNVDKNIYSYEQDVYLCNYLDVYNNDYISSEITFSKGSAKIEEVEKFSLVAGDILITKDSEDYNDIAIPALVTENLRDVLCGYHLAILRNNKSRIYSPYLFFFLRSTIVSSYFSCRANGITRYGISSGTIKNINTILPTVTEQRRIANFLDKKTAEIDEAIAKKQKLIELLQEQKAILINRAVTKGLNPNVPMRDSGIEWIGEVPEHWETKKLKYIFAEKDERSKDGSEILLSLRMVEGLIPHNDVSDKPIQCTDIIGYKKIRSGQLVMNRMRAALGLFDIAEVDGVVSPDYAIFDIIIECDSRFFLYLFRTSAMKDIFFIHSKGLGDGTAGFLRLYSDRFGTLKVPLPPLKEQERIVKRIQQIEQYFTSTLSKIQIQMNQFEELKTIIISNAVTGKVKI